MIKATVFHRCIVCMKLWEESRMCQSDDEAIFWHEEMAKKTDLCSLCRRLAKDTLDDTTENPRPNEAENRFYPALGGRTALIYPAIEIRHRFIDAFDTRFYAVKLYDNFRWWLLSTKRSAAWWVLRRNTAPEALFWDLYTEFKERPEE